VWAVIFICLYTCNQSTRSEPTTTLKFTKVVLSVPLAAHRGLCRIFHPLRHCAIVSVSRSFHPCILVSLFPFSQFPPLQFWLCRCFMSCIFSRPAEHSLPTLQQDRGWRRRTQQGIIAGNFYSGWFDHVKNTAVGKKAGLKDLPLITADRHHSLLGHICRLSPQVPAHRALQLCTDASSGILPAPDLRRPPGRPCRTWLKQVEEDLGQPVSADWITAMDRSMWRSLRPSAGHAQHWVTFCCVGQGSWTRIYQK